MATDAGAGLFRRLAVPAELQAVVERSASEFDRTGDWVTFDQLAYEAAEERRPTNLDTVHKIPSSVGGMWGEERIHLTALGLIAAGTATASSRMLARLASICAERKLALRDDATISAAILEEHYGFTVEEAHHAYKVINLLPNLTGSGGSSPDGEWWRAIWRGALEYRDVRDVDSLFEHLLAVDEARLRHQTEHAQYPNLLSSPSPGLTQMEDRAWWKPEFASIRDNLLANAIWYLLTGGVIAAVAFIATR